MVTRLTKTMSFLSVGAAFLGSCCALPLLLMSLGIGSMGFAIALAPYQPHFIAATVVFLIIAFYLVYGRKIECKSEAACDPKSVRRTKVILWTALILTIVFIFGPDIIVKYFLS